MFEYNQASEIDHTNQQELIFYKISGKTQQMFINSSNQNLLSSSMAGRNECESSSRIKLQQFQKTIRRNQLDEKKKKMREQLLQSLCEDYTILKNINLNQAISRLSEISTSKLNFQWTTWDNLINDIFLYCVSKQSDHMYCLFTEKIIQKLIKLIQKDNIEMFKYNGKTYIKIIWILGNYTIYASQVPPKYRQTVESILQDIFSIPEFYQGNIEYKIFSHSQTKHIVELILMGLTNVFSSSEAIRRECQQYDDLVRLLLKEGWKIKQFCQSNSIQNSFVENILRKIYGIFESILKLQTDSSQRNDKINNIKAVIIQILLQHLNVFKDTSPDLQIQIVLLFKSLFINNLPEQPDLLLQHNFDPLFPIFCKLMESFNTCNFQRVNYHSLMVIEGAPKKTIMGQQAQCKRLQKRVIFWLQLFIILFGLNIPLDDNEQKYYQIYQNWLDTYLMPVFYKICKVNDNGFDKIKEKIFKILEDICLEVQFCQLVLDDLTIMSKIFLYAHPQIAGIKLRKAALGCLTSIIKANLDGQTQLTEIVAELMERNQIITIFACSVGQFADQQINQSLLVALDIYLKSYHENEEQQNLFWIRFCEEGGLVKLQKFIDNQRSSMLIDLASSIIHSFSRQ